MKLQNLKQKLEKKENIRTRKIKTEYLNKDKIKTFNSIKPPKIIGITGSTGKSTMAYIVHEYLKSLGYKSVLYSSATVDSPASHIKKNEAYEIAISSEDALLSIITESEAYGAEFLVLEVNESSIAKGIVKDVPFDVRVLTNLNPKHNLEQYTEEEYVKIKKSFFEQFEDDCKCVLGFQDYDKDLLEELLSQNECEKLLFSSNYVANAKGVDPTEVTCLLNELDSTLDGLKIGVKLKGLTYKLETKLMMPYNALNFTCAMTVLEALGVLDIEKFQKCIYDIKIPGRAEVYKVNGRLVVVDTHLPKMLECLQSFKDKGFINNIKVVVGSVGYGYKNWDERFKTEEFILERKKIRKYAMELLKKYADFVYLTESDNGAESALEICQELQGYLGKEVQSVIVEDREQAIRKAILESNIGDVIFLSGRGNRRVLCNSANTMKLIKDSEVVEKVFEELNWK